MKPRWLDRRLVVSPYRLMLCTRPGQLKRRLRELGLRRRDWPEFALGARAAVLPITAHGQEVLIVCVRIDDKDSPEQRTALLVHEAVHCWQRICARLGERNPSKEMEAYAVQAIVQELLVEYARLEG